MRFSNEDPAVGHGSGGAGIAADFELARRLPVSAVRLDVDGMQVGIDHQVTHEVTAGRPSDAVVRYLVTHGAGLDVDAVAGVVAGGRGLVEKDPLLPIDRPEVVVGTRAQ